MVTIFIGRKRDVEFDIDGMRFCMGGDEAMEIYNQIKEQLEIE